MTAIDHDHLVSVADRLFADGAAHGTSLALVIRQHDEVVFERYGHQPDTLFGPGGPVTADSTLISWSMAKSITHAALGIAAGDGLVDVDGPAPVRAWRDTDKQAISMLDLLEMRSGLEFVEDYVDDAVSHCLEMLYGEGQDDMAAYAAGQALIHTPGDVFNYSSGTTNIISRIIGDALGGERDHMERFLFDRLFGPLGMSSAIPKFDTAGTFVGSSYVYATARDFSRFGQLYLNGGTWDGERILPAGWTQHAATWSANDPDGEFAYGRHWWLWPDLPGVFACHGYEGQYTVVVPDRDLVVVHLGKSPIDHRAPLVDALRQLISGVEQA